MKDFVGRTPKKHEPKYIGTKKVRMAKDGSIIFGNNLFKIHKYALAIAIIVVAIFVLSVTGVLGTFIRSFDIPEAGAVAQDHITIGLLKSNSCRIDISLGGDCMPYKDMLMFDNTNQAISGHFVDDPENKDIRRTPPRFTNHVNFYQNSGMKYLFVVDPDINWFNTRTNIRIFVEPSDFVFYDNSALKVDTTNFGYSSNSTNKITFGHDAYIEGCSFARVKGEPALVAKVISYFMNKCSSSDWKPSDQNEVMILPSIPLDPSDHKWYSYSKWMNKAMVECKTKC